MKFRILLSAALCLAPVAASAESFEALGRTIEQRSPESFCRLGESEREVALLELQTRSTAPAGALAQFTVPCRELEDFRQGKIESFSRWAQVLVVRRQGKFWLVRESREEFVRATAGNVASKPVDFAEVNRASRQHLAQSSANVAMTGMRPIGVRDSAYFATLNLVGEADGRKVPIAAVIAATVANQLPVVVQVYATTRAPDESLVEIASSYVRNVVARN